MDMLGALILPPKLSTPSFGITKILSTQRTERKRRLSTPSFGITEAKLLKHLMKESEYFQLPLSGSRYITIKGDEIRVYLSTPSFGITQQDLATLLITFDWTFNSLFRDHSCSLRAEDS